MSTKSTEAPQYRAQFAEATNVLELVQTESPGATSKAKQALCNALVAEFSTKGNISTIIVVAPPESEELFTYSGDFEITEIKAANSIGFIPVELPTQTTLASAYPNPFNPVTTINYSLGISGILTLNVYNLNGQLVETLVNGTKKAGNYSITWNASQQPSGMYFLRMEAGGEVQNRKLLLIK